MDIKEHMSMLYYQRTCQQNKKQCKLLGGNMLRNLYSYYQRIYNIILDIT